MRRVALIMLLLLALPAWAVDNAGQVVFIAGSVTAERAASSVALKKTDPIYDGDVIATGARSRGQLMMSDGAKYALRPETRFSVVEYFMTGDERAQPDGSVVVASTDSAVTELIKGGFRAITGAIDPNAYEVSTVAATMGIRGTKYNVVWCAGDCRIPPGVTSTTPIADGLYLGVGEGIVSLTNNTGEFLVRAGEYVYVRDFNTRPVRLNEKPIALIDTFLTDLVDDEQAEPEMLAALGGGTPIEPPPFPPQHCTDAPCPGFPTGPYEPPTKVVPCITCGGLPIAVALGSGPISGQAVNSFSASSSEGDREFTGDDLSAFEAPLGSFDSSIYSIGSASVQNSGFDPDTGFGWGSWSGGIARVATATGSVVDANLSMQSLHWVYGPRFDTRLSLPITGTAAYTLIAGNTNPTDTLGNNGVLGFASLFANFSAATVDSALSLTINNVEWNALGSGTFTNDLFDGTYDVCVGLQCDGTSGNFSGFFGGTGANGFPSSAALTYGLTDFQGVSVSGAIVFGSPTVSP